MELHGVKNRSTVSHPHPKLRPAQPAAGETEGGRLTRDQAQLGAVGNPYEGLAPRAVSVSVDGWKKGPNDCLDNILQRQGYSEKEIYQQDENGRTLIDRVSQVNGLKDPNLLATGRKLVVPTKKPAYQSVDTRKGAERLMERPVHRTKAQPDVKPHTNGHAASKGNFFPVQPRSSDTRKGAESLRQRPTHADVPSAPPQIKRDPKADSVEVDMLMKGVNDGKFTREEFRALNSTANQFTELRANYAKAGFTPERTAQLAQVQQQYGQMYGRFLADDKAKISFAGEKSNSPAARFHSAQNEQAGQLYDAYAQGKIAQPDLKENLLDQREAASQRGLEVSDQTKKRRRFLFFGRKGS